VENGKKVENDSFLKKSVELDLLSQSGQAEITERRKERRYKSLRGQLWERRNTGNVGRQRGYIDP